MASNELLNDGTGKDSEQVVAARGRAHKEIRKARQLIQERVVFTAFGSQRRLLECNMPHRGAKCVDSLLLRGKRGIPDPHR